jgi:hypothetical protein
MCLILVHSFGLQSWLISHLQYTLDLVSWLAFQYLFFGEFLRIASPPVADLALVRELFIIILLLLKVYRHHKKDRGTTLEVARSGIVGKARVESAIYWYF